MPDRDNCHHWPPSITEKRRINYKNVKLKINSGRKSLSFFFLAIPPLSNCSAKMRRTNNKNVEISLLIMVLGQNA